MQDFKMVYDFPRVSIPTFTFRFGVQIANEEDAISDQFSMSVVMKPMNMLTPIYNV